MSIVVERANGASEELCSAINVLLPQLSSSARLLSLDDVWAILDSDWRLLYVAREENDVVGMLTLVVFTIPTGTRAWIEDVVVDQRFRGSGAATQLLTSAISEARERGARTVDLTSRPEREGAHALYEKVGFVRRETNVFRMDLRH